MKFDILPRLKSCVFSLNNHNANYKVEFITEEYYWNRRKVFFRIIPSELVWWKRWFFNPWRKIIRVLPNTGSLSDSFDYNTFRENILPLETLGEVYDYLERQYEVREKVLKRIPKDTNEWTD